MITSFKILLVMLPLAILMVVPSTVTAQPVVTVAKPFLHPLFTDRMVLQRGIPAPVWGWTIPGQQISVRLAGPGIAESLVTATADADGKWMTKLPQSVAGGPYSLTVSGPQDKPNHLSRVPLR